MNTTGPVNVAAKKGQPLIKDILLSYVCFFYYHFKLSTTHYICGSPCFKQQSCVFWSGRSSVLLFSCRGNPGVPDVHKRSERTRLERETAHVRIKQTGWICTTDHFKDKVINKKRKSAQKGTLAFQRRHRKDTRAIIMTHEQGEEDTTDCIRTWWAQHIMS